jgi:hypothetical protein
MQFNTEPVATDTPANDKNTIRFEKCIGCSDLGLSCSGPNLALLTIPELRVWVNRWRAHYKLSVNKCAAAWDMAEGTVSRFLSSSDPDFRFATIQGIVQGILRYGRPADHQHSYNSCPITTEEAQEQIASYEKQLLEKTEENAELTARKLERANEYAERMAEQRENYEKHLEEKEKTVAFLRSLADKRQKDLEKAEAVCADYLARIDAKNEKIDKLGEELRTLNAEVIKIYTSHNAEISSLVERMTRIAEARCPRDFR